MTNAEIKEATFVLAGYIAFAWGYYKFVMWWLHKTKDKYIKIARGYVCCMFAMPTAFFVIAVLTSLYSMIWGG